MFVCSAYAKVRGSGMRDAGCGIGMRIYETVLTKCNPGVLERNGTSSSSSFCSSASSAAQRATRHAGSSSLARSPPACFIAGRKPCKPCQSPALPFSTANAKSLDRKRNRVQPETELGLGLQSEIAPAPSPLAHRRRMPQAVISEMSSDVKTARVGAVMFSMAPEQIVHVHPPEVWC